MMIGKTGKKKKTEERNEKKREKENINKHE